MQHNRTRFALTLGAALGLYAAAPAWAVTPPPAPPTFYCDANRPANADTVQAQLNTLAPNNNVNDPDRGNQPRWEWAAPSFPGVTQGEAQRPNGLNWTHFTGMELVSYADTLPHRGTRIGFYPRQPGAVANTLRYFRYQFKLDQSVDPATYALHIGNMIADDRIVGIYINDTRVSTGPMATIGGGATIDTQWKAGLNELTFAVFDTDPSATWLGISNVTQSGCVVLPPETTLAPPAGVDNATPPTFSGTTSNAPAGSTVTIVIRDAASNEVDRLTTTTDAAGNYSITRTNPLPEGTYTIESAVAGDASPANAPLVVTAAPETTLAPPAGVDDATPPTFSGTTSNAPAGSVVTIVIRDAAGNEVDRLTTTTNALGNYSITRTLSLPAGDYVIESAVAGDTSPVTGITLTVRRRSVGAPVAVPALDMWALGLLGAALGAVGMRRRRRPS